MVAPSNDHGDPNDHGDRDRLLSSWLLVKILINNRNDNYTTVSNAC